MKTALRVFALVILFASCDPNLCRDEIQLIVRKIDVPDSTNIFEETEIKAEVYLEDLDWEYTGPVIESTEDGCIIKIMGEGDLCRDYTDLPYYKWISFNIYPDRKGEYTVCVKSRVTEDLIETIFVK